MRFLRPLKDDQTDYEQIERVIQKVFREKIYLPLVVELDESPKKVLTNARSDLLEAIKSGRLEYNRGQFSGRFNSRISKELRELGAHWDSQTGTWKLPQSSLTIEIRSAISSSRAVFEQKIQAIDRKLAKILPEEIADHVKIEKHFSSVLWKTDHDLESSLRAVAIKPSLSENEKEVIAKKWQDNMRLWIKKWTKEEIVKLRKDMQDSVFAGNRRQVASDMIKKSYGASSNKAKFLARQETRLLLSTYKQARYQEARVNLYRWGCVKRPHQAAGAPYKKGEVRHDHGILEGKIFRWDYNHEVNLDGSTKSGGLVKPNGVDNPGQDYNCRCYAVPIVSFRGEKTK